MSLYEVKQTSLPGFSDSATPSLPLLKMGVPIVAPIWDLLALGGYMFDLQEGTPGTPLTGQAQNAAGIVLTAPAIRFTVPTGLTVFPRRFNLALQTAAGVLNEVAVLYGSTDTYTSGGTAVTPRNWRTDNPRASSVTNVYHCSGSAIVEAAISATRSLYKYTRAAAFAAGETFEGLTTFRWDDLIPIVGPASFLVYLGASGTALTYTFGLDWAEVPSTSV